LLPSQQHESSALELNNAQWKRKLRHPFNGLFATTTWVSWHQKS